MPCCRVLASPAGVTALSTEATAATARGGALRALLPDRANFNRTIDLDPNYAMAYVNQGWFHSEMGDVNRAISDLEAAPELTPCAAKRAEAETLLVERKTQQRESSEVRVRST